MPNRTAASAKAPPIQINNCNPTLKGKSLYTYIVRQGEQYFLIP